jgi:hypothetical protein
MCVGSIVDGDDKIKKLFLLSISSDEGKIHIKLLSSGKAVGEGFYMNK